jgi:Cysteine-rich secretory protein family
MLVRPIRNWKSTLLLLSLAAAIGVVDGVTLHAQDEREKSLVELANQAREDAGLKPLTWDAGLAAAAYAHAVRMATDGSAISHRYDGEPDLPQRASAAGAHFSLIEENIAMADTAFHVHQGWMKSQMHHDNLLNPKIDRIGVALVPSHGELYAVADYAQGVTSMSTAEVEASVGKILQSKGMTLMADASGARRYCALDEGQSGAGLGLKAGFLMRWQNSDITKLPAELEKALASGQFKQASVGSCAPKGNRDAGGPAFSGYRVAVLLY